MKNQQSPGESPDFDVIVVGAGIGGLYAVKRFRDQGLTVQGIEATDDVGGVWHHNRYPGARVDVESIYYCYYFDPELFRDWHWTERYAAQPELLAYLRHVADRYDIRSRFLFDHRVVRGRWNPERRHWSVTTDRGSTFSARFLVMATGQLSKTKRPPFDGLDEFLGEWTQTSEWRDVGIDDRRVAVVGTGSSGVQAVTAIAPRAAQTYVLQRTAGYVIPVDNGPSDPEVFTRMADALDGEWLSLTTSSTGIPESTTAQPFDEIPSEHLEHLLEEAWARKGLAVFYVISDAATNPVANAALSDFIRRKTRERIEDPELARVLVNSEYGVGIRRVVFDTGYYEVFATGTVTPVDVAQDPIDSIVPTGIRLHSGRVIEVDTIVFAIGFDAFLGAVEAADIRNEHGALPSDQWTDKPLTYLGLMAPGFPNLFLPTGPGGPSTLSSNMNMTNVHDVNVIGQIFAHMRDTGSTRVEPSDAAVDGWSRHVQEVARPYLRLQDDNYMVMVSDTGARALIPYIGGVGEYIRRVAEVVADGFRGFDFE